MDHVIINVFFKTYGCQANVADSAGLANYLEGLGCQLVESEPEADFIVVNTCAIREKAEQKLYSYIGELAPLKEINPYIKVGIIGCVASYRKKEMLKRFDHVSFVSGARDDRGTFLAYLTDVVVRLQTAKQLFETEHKLDAELQGQDHDIKSIVAEKNLKPAQHLPEAESNAALGGMLGGDTSGTDTVKKMPGLSVLSRRKGVVPTAWPATGSGVSDSSTGCSLEPEKEEKTPQIIARALAKKANESPEAKRTFVNITTGCNNYCTFCIVPFTRGREKSYPIAEIIKRVERDVQDGAKEVTLIGQNVNSYTCPESGDKFAVLLEKVAHIPGEFWVRYVSPHPKDMTDDVLEVMGNYPDKICSWSHFPLQSGSTKILEAMNRTYTQDEFLHQVDRIRALVPGVTITTDIIVGFPGETEDDFQETRKVQELVKFDSTFSFIYSRRKFTKAYRMGDTCTHEEKQDRLERLQTRQKEICLEQNQKYIGKKVRTLVEKRVKPGTLLARTSGNHRVLFTGDDAVIGQFIEVEIYDAGPAQLLGRIVESRAA